MNTKGKGDGEIMSTLQIPPWLELPKGIWANILHRLGAVEILLTAQKVCTTWRRVCKNPSMWRVIDMWNYDGPYIQPYHLEEMCRHAIVRSQGEVVDIRLSFFATKELLFYVAERSRKLKKLSITWYCYSKLQREGFIKVVQKLPSLEELSLIDATITAKAFEALERSWSWFKSLELKKISSITKSSDEINEEALAIAQSLPALRRLQLIRNYMTNEGLQAILDGCPNLVSLDMRGCFNVRLDKVLSSKSSRHIKDVKLPHNSMEGFEL
ncbi:putative F-box/LRR-repeat protein 23 [Nicotiana tabacum]|uniref:putative F-box/LRR-repeat protein 23 n=1 Tax=Nicotiana tabacum TaxID=4097 RepID=UPI003F4EE488